MPYCHSCSKIAGYEGDEEPEVEQEPEVEGLTATATVKVAKNCAECGSEMRVAYFEVEAGIEEERLHGHYKNLIHENGLDVLLAECGVEQADIEEAMEMLSEGTEETEVLLIYFPDGPPNHEVEAELDELVQTEGVQRTDRQGNAIKNTRYMKTLRGFEGQMVFRCACGEELDRVEVKDQMPASGFEEA